ncbi:universal stress protein [Actinocatenispora rupis]|uniref:Universal stress protein A n=1 Tax=Actinocatenispora rupis TaxID=519421 RepID=A0A8J3J7V1_9ACTN|nr:universal stress protein [Actinocatenispora rupis]GID09978.1 universal stress protein A [Actinocatenispora rupis]
MYRTIVVAVGGSDDSTRTVAHAADLAAGLGSRVVVLHVRAIDADMPVPGAVPTGATIVQEDARTADEVVDTALAVLSAAGVTAEADVADAMRTEVPRAILELAGKHQADLILTGMHQRGLLGSLVGSIGDRVARHADCPVLLVP